MQLIRFFYIFFALLILLINITMVSHAYANDDLWQALKEGKKVIIMRHAPVNKGSKTGNPLVRDPSCKNEKNLSAQGKLNAELVSHHFKKHQIPVSKVLHSPFCRTTDTAKIIFGEASPAEYLSLIEILSSEEATLIA